jgi:hypothetical protein
MARRLGRQWYLVRISAARCSLDDGPPTPPSAEAVARTGSNPPSRPLRRATTREGEGELLRVGERRVQIRCALRAASPSDRATRLRALGFRCRCRRVARCRVFASRALTRSTEASAARPAPRAQSPRRCSIASSTLASFTPAGDVPEHRSVARTSRLRLAADSAPPWSSPLSCCPPSPAAAS